MNFSPEDLNESLPQHSVEHLLIELLGEPAENDHLRRLEESQSPAATNQNYAQAMRIVNQVKSQEKK